VTGPVTRLIALLLPQWRRLLLASLLACATVAFGIGLMGTSGWLIASAARRPGIAVLQVAIVGVRFFGIGRGLLRYLERLASHDVTLRILSRLRTGLFESVVRMAPSRLAERRTGDLLARLVEDVDTLDRLPVRAVIPSLAAVVVAALVALLLRPFGSGVVLTVLLGLVCAGVAAPIVASRVGAAAGRRSVGLRADLHAALVDGVQGVADIIAFGRGGDHASRVSSMSRSLGSAQRQSASASALGGALAGLVADLTVVAVLVLAVPGGDVAGVSGAHLTAMVLMTIAAFEAVSSLPAAYQELGTTRAAARRIFEVADAQPSVAIPVHRAVVPDQPDVEAIGLTFAYPGSPRPAVADVGFRLAPGRPVVIVGPSGSGKSTVVALLVRQLEFEAGILRFGGVDARSCHPDDVRSHIAVAMQRTHLFTGTLRENLLLARPGASEQELIDATTRARLRQLVSRWPDGYDTWLGEQGLQLSGGERRRVALARAFLTAAPILVLDEPTADLDALTEGSILQDVWSLSTRRATLVVTHRVSGIHDDAEVLVMRDGNTVERGRAGDLALAGGYFSRMLSLERERSALSFETDGVHATAASEDD
jgi:ATP-binding cassette, subfamily C, bacterial CydC